MSTDLGDEVKEDGERRGGLEGQAEAADNGCFIVDTHRQLNGLFGL